MSGAVKFDNAEARVRGGETLIFCQATGTEDKPRITLSLGGCITMQCFEKLKPSLCELSPALFDDCTAQEWGLKDE